MALQEAEEERRRIRYRDLQLLKEKEKGIDMLQFNDSLRRPVKLISQLPPDLYRRYYRESVDKGSSSKAKNYKSK